MIEPDVQVEGVALIAALAEAGAAARLLGGVAIAQHRHAGWSASFDRVYGDIDLVTGSRSRRAVEGVLEAAPKGLRWRARAKVGRRVPWREQPEEHEAGIHG